MEKIVKSKLLKEATNRKVYGISLQAGVAFAGWDADCYPVSQIARQECDQYRENFGVEISPDVLAGRLGHYMHAYTCYGGYRPYGIAILLAAYDEHDKQAYLHLVEPSGVQHRFKGCSIGKGRQTVKTELEKLPFENMTVKEGLKEIAKIIRLVQNDEEREKPFEFEASWICEASGWKYEVVPKSIREESDAWYVC